MAESSDIVTTLVEIVIATLKASKLLHDAVKDFQAHKTHVQHLMSELRALANVLDSLKDHVGIENVHTFVPLQFPLEQCTDACRGMRVLIEQRVKRSDGSRTSFRDWANLRYMKSSLADFTNMLAGYKSTITIALADANLRTAQVTLDQLNEHKYMIQDTKDELEQHLLDINHRLQSFVPSSREHATTLAADFERVSNEKDGIESCFMICSNFLEQFNTVQFQLIPTQIAPSENSSVATPTAHSKIATITTSSMVESFKTTVTHQISLLQVLRKNTEASLQLESTTTSDDTDLDVEGDLERLRKEVKSTKQRLEIVDDAMERVHIIENIRVGDNSSQVCIPAGKLIVRGATAGKGSLQLFGQIPSDALLDVMRGQNERQFIHDRDRPADDDSGNSGAPVAEQYTSTSGEGN